MKLKSFKLGDIVKVVGYSECMDRANMFIVREEYPIGLISEVTEPIFSGGYKSSIRFYKNNSNANTLFANKHLIFEMATDREAFLYRVVFGGAFVLGEENK